ncbi:MAG TPA: hypothetical protein VFY14_08725 [Streptomyces sp.]|nr:hypothetical protein [Streptomyces sp.]
MAHTTQQGRQGGSTTSQDLATGLVIFASVLLIVGGILDVLRGIMGIAGDEILVTTPDYTFQWDTTAWGWIHLILGAVAILVGVGLLSDALWARIAGVVIAVVLILANFLSLPYYPVWSIVLIAFYVFVIWALSVRRQPL